MMPDAPQIPEPYAPLQPYALWPAAPGEAFELIYTALGEASMCWLRESDYAPQAPPGVFDSSRASQIGKQLYASLIGAGILRQQVHLDHVAPDLIQGLQQLFDLYGPKGVADVAVELADAWADTLRQSRASNDRYVATLQAKDVASVNEEFPDLKDKTLDELKIEVVQLRTTLSLLRDREENPEVPDRDPADFDV
jgi:hypothetical protein